MNQDTNEKPNRYSILVMRRGNCMMIREFSKKNNNFKSKSPNNSK